MAYSHDQPPMHYQFTMAQLGDPRALAPFMPPDPHAVPRYKQDLMKPAEPGWVNPVIPDKSISIDDYTRRLAAALLSGGK